MGCCFSDDTVDYGVLRPEEPLSNYTLHEQGSSKPSKQDSPQKTKNRAPRSPPEALPPPLPEQRQSSFIKKTSSINDNPSHLQQYHHVHIVRPPSYLESSGQMTMFQDEKNIKKLLNPNLSIRFSNPPYKPTLEGIREEPFK